MVRKTRYQTEYNTIPEDNVIRNSQDIEKSMQILSENDPKGSLVMGFDLLPWDVNLTMPTATA